MEVNVGEWDEFPEGESSGWEEFQREDYLFEIGGAEAYETRRVSAADDGRTAARPESEDGLLWLGASGGVLMFGPVRAGEGGSENPYARRRGWFGERLAFTRFPDVPEEIAEALGHKDDAAASKYRLAEVMRRCGVRLRRRAAGGAVANCPSAAHRLRSATLLVEELDSDKFRCTACGASGGVFEFVGLLHGVASYAEQYRLLTGSDLASKLPRGVEKALGRVGRLRREQIFGSVSDERRSLAYEFFLQLLPITAAHYEALERGFDFFRGYAENSFRRFLEAGSYRSLPCPVRSRVALAESLAHDFCLEGVPGFFRIPEDAPDQLTRGRWCFEGDRWGRRVAGVEGDAYQVGGYVVPVRGPSGLIVGLEVYNDPPPGDAPACVRLLWLEARVPVPAACCGATGGATGGARLHHSRPAELPEWEVYPGGLIVTDGALRVDALAAWYEAHVVGVPHFGMLVDETLEVASRFGKMLVAAGRIDERSVLELCRAAEERSIKTEVFWRGPEAGQAILSFTRDPSWPFFVPEKAADTMGNDR